MTEAVVIKELSSEFNTKEEWENSNSLCDRKITLDAIHTSNLTKSTEDCESKVVSVKACFQLSVLKLNIGMKQPNNDLSYNTRDLNKALVLKTK